MYNTQFVRSIAWAITAGLTCSVGAQTVLYVNSTALISGDGSSWASAFNGLQPALETAEAMRKDVVQIWVAAGTYVPTARTVTDEPRSATFHMLSGVGIYGGFAGDEKSLDERDPLVHQTILSGDLAGDDIPGDDGPVYQNPGDNAYHVVTATGTDMTAVLDGVTVTGGRAGVDAIFDAVRGAALYCNPGSPRINDCVFRDNQAEAGGGALAMKNGSEPIITNTDFVNNYAYRVTLFTPQSGPVGGAIACWASEPDIVGCTFDGNRVGCNFPCPDNFPTGGAVFLSTPGLSPRIIRSEFVDNRATNWGGALAVLTGRPVIQNCIFRKNVCSGGGAVAAWPCTLPSVCSEPTFVNCAFIANAGFGGAGAMHQTNGTGFYINCTFVHNDGPAIRTVGFFGEGEGPTVINSIVWNNGGFFGDPSQIVGTVHVTRSLVEGTFNGGGREILDEDPLFIDALGPDGEAGTDDDDLRLQFTSPAIDFGDSRALPTDVADLDGDGDAAEPIPFDLDGLERIVGRAVDLGAYESRSSACATDLDSDGVIGPADLAQLLGSWGPNPDDAADFDDDGVVGPADLALLLGSWGPCE